MSPLTLLFFLYLLPLGTLYLTCLVFNAAPSLIRIFVVSFTDSFCSWWMTLNICFIKYQENNIFLCYLMQTSSKKSFLSSELNLEQFYVTCANSLNTWLLQSMSWSACASLQLMPCMDLMMLFPPFLKSVKHCLDAKQVVASTRMLCIIM
jgi:hypothetical protein